MKLEKRSYAVAENRMNAIKAYLDSKQVKSSAKLAREVGGDSKLYTWLSNNDIIHKQGKLYVWKSNIPVSPKLITSYLTYKKGLQLKAKRRPLKQGSVVNTIVDRSDNQIPTISKREFSIFWGLLKFKI